MVPGAAAPTEGADDSASAAAPAGAAPDSVTAGGEAGAGRFLERRPVLGGEVDGAEALAPDAGLLAVDAGGLAAVVGAVTGADVLAFSPGV